MHEDFAPELIDACLRWPGVLGFDDFKQWVDQSDPVHVRLALNDPRIIKFQDSDGVEWFIAREALTKWFLGINFRLSRMGHAKVTDPQLAGLFSFLRTRGRWQSTPIEIIRWGMEKRLVNKGHGAAYHAFPLAAILRHIPIYCWELSTSEWWFDFINEGPQQMPFKELFSQGMETIFAKFKPRVTKVLKEREGLVSSRIKKLSELGDEFGCSRERIRQFELAFWKQIHWHAPTLLTILLRDLFARDWGLVIDSRLCDQVELNQRLFLAKCAEIPVLDLPHLDAVIIGASESESGPLGVLEGESIETDYRDVGSSIASSCPVPLNEDEIMMLARRLGDKRVKKVGAVDRVRQVMKRIGKPAHYSSISDLYEEMFPDHPTSVHQILSRQEQGIVWIGLKGVYALRDWGYERPDKTLFDTVADIVLKAHKQTRKPVSFSMIEAEIGKYRAVVNPSSLSIAAYCNPKLEKAGKDSFIPKRRMRFSSEGLSRKELDRLLEDFQRSR